MVGVWDIVLRLCSATLCGLLIGAERKRRERAAGMRTMALVALGSAIFTVVSAYAFRDLAAAYHTQFDPTRVMAQIVTGIGFLGAGTIFLRRDVVRGLTTAAALWVVAGIGMACGSGLWVPVVVGMVTTLLVLAALRPIERLLFPAHGPHKVLIRLNSVAEAGAAIPRVRSICAAAGIQTDGQAPRRAHRHRLPHHRCQRSGAGPPAPARAAWSQCRSCGHARAAPRCWGGSGGAGQGMN
jgi:putative Mg2+ transporter-C (MgtC) family protein